MSSQCANPLLLKWVKEWMDAADARSVKSYYTYKKAYESLLKCPIEFSHPSEAIQLQGIGEKMVERFQENMRKYCKDNNLPMPSRPTKKGKRKRDSQIEPDDEPATSSQPRRPKPAKPYVPGYRTGGYAILLALLDFKKMDRHQVTRDQICALAQDNCDTSMTLADAGKSYTAWSSIKTLCEKGYVWKNGKPAKYSLTETGLEMAEKLKLVNESSSSQAQTSSTPESSFTLSNPSTARTSHARRNQSPEMDLSFLNALSDTQETIVDTTSRNRRGGNGKGRARKSTTSSIMDRLLAEMGGNDSNEPDMSLYVLNPSKHQTMTLNGRTVTNTSTNNNNNNHIPTPARSSTAKTQPNQTLATAPSNSAKLPTVTKNDNKTTKETLKIPRSSNASSITNSNRSSFAQRVSQAEDNNEFDDLYSRSQPKPSTSITHNKLHYNVDEFELDLTSDSVPTLPNTQLPSATADVIDLLSSPEISPALQPQKSSEFLFQDDFEKDYFPLSQSRAEEIINETFHYTYLNSLKEHVRHVTMADTQYIDGKEAHLIKFYTRQSNHPKACRVLQQIVEGDYITAYVHENTLDVISPGLPAAPVLPLHTEQPQNAFWPNEKRTSSQWSSQSLTFSQESQLTQSQPMQSQMTQSQAMNSQATQYEGIIEREVCEKMLPHEYEIFLVLDNREIQMKTNRDYFQKRLATKGVHCLTRTLDLGDVLWIAKKKNSQASTDELVLGYIVERKRLDDLVTSIKDGRFLEQKSRLRKSGADKVIYIVEEYNREEAERFGAQAIQTAMSSTQMIDGIFLKRTANIDETIDYLVSVTNLVKRIYKDTTLYSIPGHLVSQQNYLDLRAAYKRQKQPKTEYLLNYPLFNQFNAKDACTTVRDVYLHMLMTIRGVNAEKALSLMRVYPTPHALLEALDGKTPQEGKLLAKNATLDQISRRRWGTSISEKLYQTWGASAYPDTD